jgi:hypothetical protein
MNAIMKRLPSPAMVVACAALLVALGGVSYAASVLPKNSVGTAQLKKNAVTGAKIKKNAVTGAKVKDRTLMAADFKAGQLTPSPQGPKGDPGPAGMPGKDGAPGTARAYARVLIAFGDPHVIPQLSHNALAVRRPPGQPNGHFCVKVQGVSMVELNPGNPQLATAPVASAGTGFATAGTGPPCDPDEIEVQTFVNSTKADAHFSLVVP